MAVYESSIVIPVFNKWDLTRNCLKSLAGTVDKSRVEVIVIDNASTDATPKGCLFLGEKLFGSAFRYIRNEQNRNFAGASNQGAEAARGEYLVFLNNDTVAESNWYEPLLADFAEFPNLGATGPLLVYPDKGPFGHTVQHLGVLVSPGGRFGHLYQGIPENSKLAKKRRFFQAITAACMMIRKNLFLDTGRFDEVFRNGFEDVDLCGRLTAKGFRFTVNPASRIFHLESRTPGRNLYYESNSRHLFEGSQKFFKPDWDSLLKDDGLRLDLDEWLMFQPRVSRIPEAELDAALPGMSRETLKKALADHVYWQNGWEKYLQGMDDPLEYLENFKMYFNFFRTLANISRALRLGRQHDDQTLLALGRKISRLFAMNPGELLENAKLSIEWCEKENMPELAARYEQWIADYGNFRLNVYPQYIRLKADLETETS